MKKLFKRSLAILLCAIMVLGSVAVGGNGFDQMIDYLSVKASADEITTEFAGGNGTESEPFLISSPEQLDAVRNHLDSYFLQTCDINMSGINWNPIGISSSGSGSAIGTPQAESAPELTSEPFTGSYNGNGYSIKNLTIYNDSVSYTSDVYGLFACVSNAEITNLRLSGINYYIDKSTTDYVKLWNDYYSSYSVVVGGLSGNCYASTVKNIEVSGTIKVIHCNDANVGGIVAYGNVCNCTNKANIYVLSDKNGRYVLDGTVHCGGISGHTESINGKIDSCINEGNIETYVGNFGYIGGITGEYGQVTNSVNFGNVSAVYLGGPSYSSFAFCSNAGGITGANSSDNTQYCVNYGTVFCTDCAGGIIGYSGYYGSGKIKNCINIGRHISSDDGYAGRIAGSSISTTDCYSLVDTLVNGSTVIGSVEDKKNGQDLTESQLLDKANYPGFDFSAKWSISEKIGGAVLNGLKFEENTSPEDGDYKITLDANGGKFSDGSSTKTYYYDAGESLPSSLLSSNKPTKNGYTFNRWNDILPLTMPSKNITFKAEWKAEEETYINGIMNDYVTAVVLNGSSSYVSSMTVDGIKYSALNDSIKDSECSALKNKAVVLTMFAGKVKAVEPFSNYSSISVDSGIVSGIGYKTGTEESIEIDVSNAVSSKIKPVSSAILGSSSQSITVGSVTVKLSNKDGSYKTIASSSSASTIGISQTKSLLKTKVTLKTDNVTSSGYAYIIIDISGTQNGKSFNQTETKYFEVLSNSEWRKIENNSVKNQQKATDEDNTRVANAISNNASNLKLNKTIAWQAFIADAFTDAQLNALGYAMVSTIVMADEPKKTFKQYVTDKCLDKIGLEHEIPIGGFDVEVPMIVRVDSKNYGQLVIEFKAKATNFTAKSKKYASFGQITYKVIGGTGISKVPDYFKSGLAGAIAYTNIDNFASAVREIALAEIERAYNIGYGNEFEEVSEIFFNDTIVDVMVSACKTDYKGAFFDLMTHPTTKYYNQCPTEIYVYDGDNLCASIADGQAVSIDESVEVSLVGSEKTVTISGFNPEKYKIKIVALANGTMNTVIQDIAGGTRAYREQEFLSTSILENDVYYINELGGVADTTKRDTIVSDSKTISSTDDYLYSFGNTDDEPVIDATDYLEYTVSNGKATIIGCDRDVKGKLIIPQTIDGYTIIGIGNTAFANCKDITEITIPATVQNIGYGIFGGCSKLSKIIVDANNKNFSSDDDGILFNKNRTELIQYPIGSTITEYTVPYGTEKIGDSAFVYSSFLKKINLPESVIEIGQGSFAGCSVLEYVHIPSSVKTIGDVILYSNSMYPCTAYICSDSNNCYAKTYAQANNYTFRLCSSHNGVKNPTANTVISVATEQKIDYRSIITVKATAKNIPEGYILAMYIDGKTVKGTNTEVSYEYGELKSDLNYSVKVIDSNGKVQKDSNGNDLSKDSKITVNAGFFKKLIAFFRGLFGTLATIEIKP